MIEIFDLTTTNAKKFRILQSKKSIIEEAKEMTDVIRTRPPGVDEKGILHSPEICVGTDNGIVFMNVRISKTLPHMNSVYMKED